MYTFIFQMQRYIHPIDATNIPLRIWQKAAEFLKFSRIHDTLIFCYPYLRRLHHDVPPYETPEFKINPIHLQIEFEKTGLKEAQRHVSAAFNAWVHALTEIRLDAHCRSQRLGTNTPKFLQSKELHPCGWTSYDFIPRRVPKVKRFNRKRPIGIYRRHLDEFCFSTGRYRSKLQDRYKRHQKIPQRRTLALRCGFSQQTWALL